MKDGSRHTKVTHVSKTSLVTEEIKAAAFHSCAIVYLVYVVLIVSRVTDIQPFILRNQPW